MNSKTALKTFFDHYDKLSSLSGIQSVLGWDQQTMMPPGGAQQRAKQLSELGGMIHELSIHAEYEEALDAVANDVSLDSVHRGTARYHLTKLRKAKKVPVTLVQELTRAGSEAFVCWQDARKKNDYALFAPRLDHIVDLAKQYARCFREDGETEYDALVASYDPEVSAKKVGDILGAFRKELTPLVQEILSRQSGKEAPSIDLKLSGETQKEIGLRALRWMGFDFECGRLDTSAHPFCSGTGSDIRLTTRYNDLDWTRSLYGVLHEGGHGLYEQGMEKKVPIRPARHDAGMSMHESQSRFWENLIGRSRVFCEYAVEALKKEKLIPKDVTPETFYAHVNQVKPGMIRVDADEATYNLHILLRYELEADLIGGKISARDIPNLWNQKMSEYLGIRPANDAEGCLQDVHWSHGAFGYFPSYTVGNLISAQLHEKARADLDLDALISRGEWTKIRDWLGERVHRHGCTVNTLELVKSATGKELTHRPWMEYARAKFTGRVSG